MSGALLAVVMGTDAIVGGGGGGGIGSDVTPDAVNWPNCSGVVTASTPPQTISGIDTTITLSITWTGAGSLGVSKTGSAGAATGSNPTSVPVSNGDTLAFILSGVGTSGTVTVTNVSDSSTVLDTFTYAVYNYTFTPPVPPIIPA